MHEYLTPVFMHDEWVSHPLFNHLRGITKASDKGPI